MTFPKINYSVQFNPIIKVVETTETIEDHQKLFEQSKFDLLKEGLKCDTIPRFLAKCDLVDYVSKNTEGLELYQKCSLGYNNFFSPLLMMERDPRHYLELGPWLASQQAQYPINNPFVILKGNDYGATGVIADNSETNKLKLKVKKTIDQRSVNNLFKVYEDSVSSGKKIQNIQLADVCKKLGITKFMIEKILSCVLIKFETPYPHKFNIALGLIHFSQRLHVPYHVTYDFSKKAWAVSQEVVNCISEYMKRFPMLFKVLESAECSKKSCCFDPETILEDAMDTREQIDELFEWVKSLPFSNLPYVPYGTKIVHQELYKAIKNQLLTEREIVPSNMTMIKDPKEVQAERYPFWIRHLGNKAVSEYQVGDRVMNIKQSGTGYVPYACTGTIMGIHNRKLLVEFDEQTITGSSFGGFCGAGQGQIVDGSTLINFFSGRRFSRKRKSREGAKIEEQKIF